MPRDISGTYNLPPTNPVVGNTPVSVVWREQTFNDLANALTASPAGPGSVNPIHFADDPVGFQTKIGVAAILAAFDPRVDALEAANEAKIGRIRGFAFSSTPAHHLSCNGAAVSRTTYAKLFAKIGTTFGAGDGVNTFNLPDLRGETLRGWDHGRGVDVGRAIGSAQGSQLPAHTHTASSASGGGHSHTGTAAAGGVHAHSASSTAASTHTHTFSGTTANHSASHTHTWSATTSAAGGHSHTWSYSTRSGGNGSADNLLNLGTGLNRTTSSSGAHSHTFSGTTGGQSANHTHTISGTSGTSGAHTHVVTLSSGGAHTHTLTTTTDGAHTHTLTVSSTGGAEMRVDNLALHFCIKFE